MIFFKFFTVVGFLGSVIDFFLIYEKINSDSAGFIFIASNNLI